MMIKWSMLVYILLSGHFVEASDQFKLDWTLGTEAAKKDIDLKTIKALIEKGANPNTLRTRVPPLISSIRNQHFELIQYLLSLPTIDANIHALGEEARPLSLAIRSGNFDLIKMLLNRGAQIGAHSIEFKFFGTMSPRILDFLLSINPDLVDYRDANGNTPLHHAVMSGNTVNAKILRLRAHRSDILARNRVGKTSLDLALEKQQKEISAFLTEELTRPLLQEHEADGLVQELIEDFEGVIWRQEKIKELSHIEIRIQSFQREVQYLEKLIEEKTQILMDSHRVLRSKIEKAILGSSRAFIRSQKGEETIDAFSRLDRFVKKLDKGASVVVVSPYGRLEFTKQKIMDEGFQELEELHQKNGRFSEELEKFKTRCAQLKSELDSFDHENEKRASKKNEKSKGKEEEFIRIENKQFTIEPMLGNGDCGYLALSLTREEVRHRLIESLRSENRVRVINDFVEEMLAARTENPEHFARDMRLDDNEISILTEDQFRNYIRTQKTDDLMIRFINFMTSRGQWLSYIRNTRGMMNAISLVFRLEIYIFGQESLHNHYEHPNPQRTVYMLYRNRNHFDRLILQALPQEEESESSVSLQDPPEPSNERDLTCEICCDLQKNHVLNPCGHMFCKPCIDKFENKFCPLCRSAFAAVIMTFL